MQSREGVHTAASVCAPFRTSFVALMHACAWVQELAVINEFAHRARASVSGADHPARKFVELHSESSSHLGQSLSVKCWQEMARTTSRCRGLQLPALASISPSTAFACHRLPRALFSVWPLSPSLVSISSLGR